MLTAVNQQFPLGFSNKDIDPTWLPVSDFVEKPVDFEILKAKINDLLDRSRQPKSPQALYTGRAASSVPERNAAKRSRSFQLRGELS